ncbi:MAG: transcriptional repressor [Lachnospiraceae bacterium]|nr:transcriptional repressor [Lachnospiraceae bacterium]
MVQDLNNQVKRNIESANYHRTRMQREIVLQKLKERGCRITKQRQMLLDVILQEECASCKEIYYKAIVLDAGIGSATVYRMVNLLEEIGAISRKNMYRISCCMDCAKENACVIELDDNSVCQLSAQNWYKVITEGLKACGYVDRQKVTSVTVEPCANECC